MLHTIITIITARSNSIVLFRHLKNVEKRSHTKSVMVWAGISGKGETDIVFVPECTKISANSYHKFNLSKHVSQINKTFVKRNSWIFQQDEARAHSA